MMRSKSKLPVIAAIPAHNAAKTLPRLLDELIRQKYDQIFVLDDASTDRTLIVVKKYGNKVSLIEGRENVGSGANRNRIIGQTQQSIIHFIDADMRLLSKNTPSLIRSIKWPENVAFVGGLVRNPDGTQNPFNYGPRPHLLQSVVLGRLQYLTWLAGLSNKHFGRFLKRLFNPLLHNFPPIYSIPKPRRVYWSAESNMLIKSDLFQEHNGYDPDFRYSEIEDLALRFYRHGLHGLFDSRIDAIHATNDNLLKSAKKRNEARKVFSKKHGHLVYLVPFLSDYFDGRKTQKRYHR